MSEQTGIQWCDSTMNPWIGCTNVGPGCDNCYAEALMDGRMGVVKWGAGQPRKRTSAAYWRKPVAWNNKARMFRQCGGCGWRGEVKVWWEPVAQACPECDRSDWRPARRRVFCASLADVFDNEVDPQWRADLFELIAATPNLDWLLLTKRIGNARGHLFAARDVAHASGKRDLVHWLQCWIDGRPPFSVWLGATVVNQTEADRDIPKLLDVPARVRFLSVEPMLGPMDLDGHEYTIATGLGEGIDWLTGRTSQHSSIFGGSTSPWLERDCYDFPKDAKEPRIHQVICGGESGHNARPMAIEWAQSLRDQCKAAGVAFFMKQLGGARDKRGELSDMPESLRVREFPR